MSGGGSIMTKRMQAAEMIRSTRGDLYDANFDPVLAEVRGEAKDLCFDYNYSVRPSEVGRQQAILGQLLGRVGAGVTVVAPFWCDYGSNIELGDGTFLNHNTVMLDGASITFGRNVFVAPDCCFSTAGHPLDVERRNLGLEYALPITVEDDVWIGAGVMVLPGVTIGRGSVIGAGSVVNRDIPAGVVAVGCPCRPIRSITNKDAEMGQLWRATSR